MGRGPRATISFTYCIARVALKAGGLSAGWPDSSACLSGVTLAVEAAAGFSLEHANSAMTKIRKANFQVFMLSFGKRVLAAGWGERNTQPQYLQSTRQP